MTHNLVPQFILQNFSEGKLNGRFPAVTLFVDIYGFTPLTTTLMQHGKAGAEIIANVLADLFQPLVQIVYRQGGYISGFAGDSFKAVFSLENEPMPDIIYERAVSAAWKIRSHMAQHTTYQTDFGMFTFNVKASVADGEIIWGIWQAVPTHKIDATDQRNAYYFEGEAFSRCLQADSFAAAGDVLLTESVYTAVSRRRTVHASPIHTFWRLQTYERSDTGLTRIVRSPVLHRVELPTNYFFPDKLMPDTRGEFRQVITIFVNLQAMPGPTDPFVSTFFRLLNQYDGYLCRVGRIGDQDDGGTLLLFWGAPISYESDIERALTFAHKLRQESPIPLRMGITTHMAYAGYVGTEQRDEYTCHGSHVNLAARQMVLGSWGDVLLDENTAVTAAEHFNSEEIGRFALKGFQQKQRIYQLLKEQPETGDPFFQGALVGREQELQQLQNAFYPLTQGQFAGVITIIGEAGIGKSRLAHTFLNGLELNWVQAISPQSSVLSPQSYSPLILLCQTDDIIQESLNPFRYMLRLLFDQRSDADEQENKTRFDARMDEFVAQTPALGAAEAAVSATKTTLARSRSFLGALINLFWPDSLYEQLDPKLRFANMQAALKTLLISLATTQPVILHLEDAHWLDKDSLNFLQQLMRNIEEIPFALIMTTRIPLPERFFEDDPPIPQTTIPMRSLPSTEIAEFAVDLLKQPVMPGLLAELTDRTDGNPFFMEQLLLYWRENDLLRQTKSGLVVIDDADAIPADVRTVLTSRLDRLLQTVRHVVQTAAVLGRKFELTVLTHMLQGDQELPEKVKAAADADIWSAITELNYLFKHALLRDAAYEMQLQSHLRELHHLAAEAMIQLYATDLAAHYAEIAYHYDHADMPRQAAVWYKLAGERAAKLYANKEANAYLERALALTPDYEYATRYQILLHREQLHKLQGERESQAVDLEALDFLAEALADGSETAVRRQTEVALRRAGYAELMSDFETAVQFADTAVSLAQKNLDTYRLASAYAQLGRVLWPLGRFDAAREKLNRALTLARQADLRTIEAYSLRYLGVVADFQGDYEEAIDYATQSLAINQEINDLPGISSNLNNLGITKLKQGKYKEARQYLEEALQNHRAIGYRSGESWALANLGFVSSIQGLYADADRYYLEALAIFRELGDTWSRGMAYGHLGMTAVHQHNYSQSQHYHEEALSIFKQVGYRQGEGMALASLGAVAGRMGQWNQAESLLKEAVALHRDLAVQRGLGQSLTAYSQIMLQMGNPASAEKSAQEAIEIAAEIGERQIHAMALTKLGNVQTAQNKPEEAAVSYQKARKLWHALGTGHLALDAQAGLARVALVQNDVETAVQHISPILDYLAKHPLHGPDEPEQILWTCVQVLQAAGDARKTAVLGQAYHLVQTNAANLATAADRQTYLNNIPANRQIIKLVG
ncbi:MAG: tetratricopeptide repeat protein [Anaerolineales bacterium]|nr:tetratricopeptide repeat protein [Anaerolineales bacterium]